MSDKNNAKQSNKLFYVKLKFSFISKKIKKFVRIYFTLPHIWISIIILILSFIALSMSIYYKDSNFISSICANIFAGLITGLVISLISAIKEISLYIANCKITWLYDIHTQCLNFFKNSKNLYFFKKSDFSSEEKIYEKVYDLLCLGNAISVSISQSQFNETLPFNGYKFFRKVFNYDSVEQEKINSELREQVLKMDVPTLTGKKIRELFKQLDNSIMELNSKILNKIKEIEIKIKATSLT